MTRVTWAARAATIGLGGKSAAKARQARRGRQKGGKGGKDGEGSEGGEGGEGGTPLLCSTNGRRGRKHPAPYDMPLHSLLTAVGA